MELDTSLPSLDAQQEQHPFTIIVGTGRCGSTMLSNLLREHPGVLSLSEFFALLEGPKFGDEVLDASQFWSLIGIPGPGINGMMRRGIRIAEFLYPVSAHYFHRSRAAQRGVGTQSCQAGTPAALHPDRSPSATAPGP